MIKIGLCCLMICFRLASDPNSSYQNVTRTALLLIMQPSVNI